MVPRSPVSRLNELDFARSQRIRCLGGMTSDNTVERSAKITAIPGRRKAIIRRCGARRCLVSRSWPRFEAASLRCGNPERGKEIKTEHALARRHTSKTFLDLLEPIRDALYRHARRTLWGSGQTDDVVQEAIMTAWREFHRFELGTNFSAWMFRILINTTLTANKRFKRRREVTMSTMSTDWTASLEREEAWSTLLQNPGRLTELLDERLADSLGRLNEDERQCLLLRTLGDFSYKDIASMLEIPLGTAMSHVHRARIKLREELATLAVEEGIVREAS